MDKNSDPRFWSEAETAAFFEERRKRANREAFLRILNRKGGEPPRPGDELPEGYEEDAATMG